MKKTEEAQQALKTLRLRYLMFYTMLQTVSILTFFNFIFGSIFLLLRQLRLVSINFIGFSLAGIPVCLLIALAIAFRRQLDDERGMAILDSHNKSGGMLLAEFETRDLSWNNRLKGLEAPRLRMNLWGRMPALLVSIIFIALSVTIPVRQIVGARDPRLELQDIQQSAKTQVEALEDAGLVDEQKADELKQTITQIARASDSNDPSKTFEAFDQLQEKMRKESSVGVQKMLAEQENLQSLQTLADQLKNAASPEQISQALNALQEKLEQCGMDAASIMQPGGKSLADNMQKAGQKDGQAAEAAVEATQQLRDYISQRAEEARAAAEKLVKARLIDRKTYEKLKQEGRLRPATEADLAPGSGADLVIAPIEEANTGGDKKLDGQSGAGSEKSPGGGKAGSGSKTQPGSGKPGDGPDSGNGQSPMVVSGSGVPSGQAGRDGGSAPLDFSRESSEHQLKFKDEALPSPAIGKLEDSVAIGMAIAAPQVENADGQKNSGQIDWQKSEKSGAESDIILPRHRSAVKRYFERNVTKQRRQQ